MSYFILYFRPLNCYNAVCISGSWFTCVVLRFLFSLLFSSRPRSEQSLVRWATPQLHDIDALAKMVDPALNGMYPAKSLSRFADIIALCVQVNPSLSLAFKASSFWNKICLIVVTEELCRTKKEETFMLLRNVHLNFVYSL